MKWFARLVTTALLAAGLSSAGKACGPAASGRALIHSALPAPLPEGLFIADVELGRSTLRRYRGKGIRARVRKVIQGDTTESRVILRPDYFTSCDTPSGTGVTGLIVGIPRGSRRGVLIVHPITVNELSGFRLPDGFSVPAECREKPCPIVIGP